LVEELVGRGIKVVTVFLSGRPLVVEALERSEAFVAAFLPGSEGGRAIVDLLLGKDGAQFEGKLAFTWPISAVDGAYVKSRPRHFSGGEEEWRTTLQRSAVREVAVGRDYAYPWGFGLGYKR
jgi:hypothetical protein